VDNLFDILFTRSAPADQLWVWGNRPHLIYTVLVLGAIIVAVRWFRRVPPESQPRVIQILAGAAFSMWIIPPVLMCITDTGERWIDHLPLHLCSSACLVIPTALLTRNKTLLNYTYALCFPGAVAAILTPGEVFRTLSSYGVHYFLFNFSHLILILACLAPIAMGIYRPRWRYYPTSLGIGLLLMAIDYPINKWLGSNYMFVNWPEPGTILDTFAGVAGNPGYIGLLVIFAAVVVALLYGTWSLIELATRRPAPRSLSPA
jgi:hypothetical integral membrane protein (TIGR02206 family)